jgi:hypothetical protein
MRSISEPNGLAPPGPEAPADPGDGVVPGSTGNAPASDTGLSGTVTLFPVKIYATCVDKSECQNPKSETKPKIKKGDSKFGFAARPR